MPPRMKDKVADTIISLTESIYRKNIISHRTGNYKAEKSTKLFDSPLPRRENMGNDGVKRENVKTRKSLYEDSVPITAA